MLLRLLGRRILFLGRLIGRLRCPVQGLVFPRSHALRQCHFVPGEHAGSPLHTPRNFVGANLRVCPARNGIDAEQRNALLDALRPAERCKQAFPRRAWERGIDRQQRTILDWLPEVKALERTTRVIKEYMGIAVPRSHALRGNAFRDALRPAPQSGANRHSHAERGNEENITDNLQIFTLEKVY